MERFAALFIVMIAGISVSNIAIYPNHSLALPLDVTVLESTYSTSVSTTYDEFVDGSVVRNSTSRENTSSVPLSDSLARKGHIEAVALANPFQVSAHTSSLRLEDNTFGVRSTATATSQLTFLPVSSGLTNIGLNFTGDFEWFFSSGSVSLSNTRLGQELWKYAWSSPISGSNVPWVDTTQTPRATATLTVPTFLSSTDRYELSTFLTTTSNPPDRQFVTIDVSGIHKVPEPSTIFLLGCSLAILVAWRRKRRPAL